ncbi:MAG: LacI family DNA-binding transcriptional regulator [Pseudomonadota bacterium]
MVRMIDVARQAGVSSKTVSRVLNNEPHVQDAMRERVREAMDRLGYVPSISARSLRSRKSFTIMLLVHDVRSAFVNTVQFGALRACQELGYHLQLALVSSATLESEKGLQNWFEGTLRSGQPDGFVLFPPMASNPVVERVVARMKIAAMRVGPHNVPDGEHSATVTIDDKLAAYQMTEHLLELGHKRIAFIRGKEDQFATQARYEGYAQALGDAGLSVDKRLVLPGTFDFESGLDAGERLLKRKTPPTAVFAANDDMATGVIMAAHRAGVDVPKDLSVVGFDDSEVALRTWPALTTVRQPLEELGVAAVNSLVSAKNTPETRLASATLPFEIILRNSTAAPRES